MTLADADRIAPGCQVTLTLKVPDVAALRAAAAQRALAAPGTSPADVFDVIGPREDPSLAQRSRGRRTLNGIGHLRRHSRREPDPGARNSGSGGISPVAPWRPIDHGSRGR